MSDTLRGALAASLEMSTDVPTRRSGGCGRHERLVEGLRPRDTIISFNYDCVIDHALRKHGNAKWSARHGYTFPLPGRIEGIDNWNPSKPARNQRQTVYLLKLHGSLNWQLPEETQGTIVLKQRLHSQYGTPRFSIIPPVWNKATTSPMFEVIWRNAERAIRGAKHLAVVGFSFAPTDLHAESLFRLALYRSSLKTLVIANPSQTDRRRIRDVCTRALRDGGIIRQYEGFAEFVDDFPACFS